MNDHAPTHDVPESVPATAGSIFEPSDTFIHRHIGPDGLEIDQMLGRIGVESLDALVDQAMPSSIRSPQEFGIGTPRSEQAMQEELHTLAARNRVLRSCIGMGYHGTITPPVILRNILENPGWYTQYTPYQPEVAQGRLESLMNFQTMVSDLTGFELCNASLLDESTAAAEAMSMIFAGARKKPQLLIQQNYSIARLANYPPGYENDDDLKLRHARLELLSSLGGCAC